MAPASPVASGLLISVLVLGWTLSAAAGGLYSRAQLSAIKAQMAHRRYTGGQVNLGGLGALGSVPAPVTASTHASSHCED